MSDLAAASQNPLSNANCIPGKQAVLLLSMALHGLSPFKNGLQIHVITSGCSLHLLQEQQRWEDSTSAS